VKKEEIQSYLVLEINRTQSGLIISRRDLFEGRLKRKGLFNPHTVGNREARTTSRSGVFEDDGNKLRDKRVEMISGFRAEEVEKLLLSKTWIDNGENTMLLSDCFEKRCLAMLRNTLF
jgi:hypothetical protein